MNNQLINIGSNVSQRFRMGIVPKTENTIIHIDWNVSQSASRVMWNVLC
jgi:hypothetical protein